MATQATPGNERPDIRAGGATSPGAHQAGIQGREAELRLIGGLLVATGFTLVVVPVLYSILRAAPPKSSIVIPEGQT